VAQFVPLELDVEEDSWQTWAQRFPSEGGGIPIIYIVRADGEVLYNESGAPQGAALPQLLGGFLQQAGEPISAKQAEKVTQAVTSANQALEAGNVAESVATIAPFAGLRSYARPAVDARALVEKLTEEAKAAIGEAGDQLASETDALNGAVTFARLARVYKRLPAVLRLVNDAKKEHKDPALKPLFTQASLIDKAQVFAEQGQAERAVQAFQSVVTRYPDTPAAELAQARMVELGGTVAEGGAGDAAATEDKPPTGAAAGPAPSDADLAKARSKLRLAKAYAKTNAEKARALAQEAIGLAPGTDVAQEAEELMAGLE
jgi:tetratricopeptide (TPR) repeat protein